MLSSIALAQSDTLWIGTPQVDPLDATLIQCYPYKCPPDSSHTYFCPSAYNGVLDIFGVDGAEYEVMIVTEHQFVRVDTCAVLWSFAGGQLNLPYSYSGGFEVVVNGPEGAWVMIESKVDTAQVHPPLPSAFLDMDTLCATMVNEPAASEAGEYRYYDFETFELTQRREMKANHQYLPRK